MKIDGEWYHADLTWDDSISGESKISRRHFLCSDKIARERGHRDWYSSVNVSCNSERFADESFEDLYHIPTLSGDSDHNGKIELPDLLQIRGYVDLGADLTCYVCADADRDGEISLSDAKLLRKKLLGID